MNWIWVTFENKAYCNKLRVYLIIIITIIILYFKNITHLAWMQANIWSSVTKADMSLITEQHYLQYVQSKWGLSTPSMLREGYPTLLTWRIRRGRGEGSTDLTKNDFRSTNYVSMSCENMELFCHIKGDLNTIWNSIVRFFCISVYVI